MNDTQPCKVIALKCTRYIACHWGINIAHPVSIAFLAFVFIENQVRKILRIFASRASITKINILNFFVFSQGSQRQQKRRASK